ncbi:uncharacterized protein LOC142235299 [Haematobia irritans]|uniref:uncharacterized protein LOC142235299 n=1 Tax=Haematobia irritans TaxID=7368 RepID=UPI003F4F8655
MFIVFEVKFVLFLLLSVCQIYGKSLHFLSTKVSYNPKYLADNRFDISQDGKLDLIITVAQDYKRDQWSMVDIALKHRNAKSYRTLLKYDLNLCKVFATTDNKIISDLSDTFLQQGNMPRKCPITKGNYSWHLDANSFKIPQFFPPSQYRILMNSYFRLGSTKDSIGNLTLFLAIK